jgi:hypothetical protein
MTFGTVAKGLQMSNLRHMTTFVIIAWIASATGVFALIGILGREAQRADEATQNDDAALRSTRDGGSHSQRGQ